VLGVKPLKPGFAEFKVEPKPCDLEWAEGVIPSPAGDIPVSWKNNEGEFILSVQVPTGTAAEVFLPPGGRVTANGRPLDKTRLKVSQDGDSRRVYCPAGNYTFNLVK
jgi:hypothetical protein